MGTLVASGLFCALMAVRGCFSQYYDRIGPGLGVRHGIFLQQIDPFWVLPTILLVGAAVFIGRGGNSETKAESDSGKPNSP